jgi:hypothetical protein
VRNDKAGVGVAPADRLGAKKDNPKLGLDEAGLGRHAAAGEN